MKLPQKKRRIRSVILVSALGAMACGGKAQESGNEGPRPTTREGDGDGDPQGFVGEQPGDIVGGDGDGDLWVGEPVGDVGVPPNYCGAFPEECLGEPPYEGTGGQPGLGGMGGMGGALTTDDEQPGIVR